LGNTAAHFKLDRPAEGSSVALNQRVGSECEHPLPVQATRNLLRRWKEYPGPRTGAANPTSRPKAQDPEMPCRIRPKSAQSHGSPRVPAMKPRRATVLQSQSSSFLIPFCAEIGTPGIGGLGLPGC
jgi:hypothetical protein